mgnify:CR=1 FL=1
MGYSYNTNNSFQLNDYTTGEDNLRALLDFFEKYPEYRDNNFFIAGESYAGKYIPHLAKRVDEWNEYYAEEGKKVNMKGLLVGNGIMSYNHL